MEGGRGSLTLLAIEDAAEALAWLTSTLLGPSNMLFTYLDPYVNGSGNMQHAISQNAVTSRTAQEQMPRPIGFYIRRAVLPQGLQTKRFAV